MKRRTYFLGEVKRNFRLDGEKYIIRNERFDPKKVTPFVFQKKQRKGEEHPTVEVNYDGFEIMTTALKNTVTDYAKRAFVRLSEFCRIPA